MATKWETTFEVADDGLVTVVRRQTLTVCRNDHPLVASNVVIRAGRPVCLKCERRRSREHKRRKLGHKPRAVRTLAD